MCYACGGKFGSDKKGEVKVRDHCHFTGRFRGALHSRCNLRLARTRTIPVIFCNLRGYDSHLFVKELGNSPGDVNCIPENEEKYITFEKCVVIDPDERDKEEKRF